MLGNSGQEEVPKPVDLSGSPVSNYHGALPCDLKILHRGHQRVTSIIILGHYQFGLDLIQ